MHRPDIISVLGKYGMVAQDNVCHLYYVPYMFVRPCKVAWAYKHLVVFNHWGVLLIL